MLGNREQADRDRLATGVNTTRDVAGWRTGVLDNEHDVRSSPARLLRSQATYSVAAASRSKCGSAKNRESTCAVSAIDSSAPRSAATAPRTAADPAWSKPEGSLPTNGRPRVTRSSMRRNPRASAAPTALLSVAWTSRYRQRRPSWSASTTSAALTVDPAMRPIGTPKCAVSQARCSITLCRWLCPARLRDGRLPQQRSRDWPSPRCRCARRTRRRSQSRSTTVSSANTSANADTVPGYAGATGDSIDEEPDRRREPHSAPRMPIPVITRSGNTE